MGKQKFDLMLESAARKRATDIRIDTRPTSKGVWFRVFGNCVLQAEESLDDVDALSEACAVASGTTLEKLLEEQRGSIAEANLPNGYRFAKVAVAPADGAAVIVLRLGYEEAQPMNLDDLGYSQSQINALKDIKALSPDAKIFPGAVYTVSVAKPTESGDQVIN